MQKLKNIDVKIGLSHMSENHNLYLNVLNDFKIKYSNFKFENFNDKELKLEIHTLKGLSASIGANSLHIVASELDNSHEILHLTKVYKELDKVLIDLSTLFLDAHKPIVNKIDVPHEKIEELFIKLKEAAKSKRPNNCKPILEELERYKLNNILTEYFTDIQSLLLKFKFKDAIVLIDFVNYHISLHHTS